MSLSRLEQSARKMAFGRARVRDIRRDMKELTLTALRAHALTLPNVAAVAAAITHGIDPALATPASRASASHSLAQQGLTQAIATALAALDIAIQEYANVGGRIAAAELGEWLSALESIGAIEGDELAARLATVRAALGATESAEAADSSYALSLLASGALLGLIEADRPRGREKSVSAS